MTTVTKRAVDSLPLAAHLVRFGFPVTGVSMNRFSKLVVDFDVTPELEKELEEWKRLKTQFNELERETRMG